MKTEIHNLIIIDESGSMGFVCRQTINGCNETIDTIKNAQHEFAETQTHYVSIFAFNDGGAKPSRFIIKNVPAYAVEPLKEADYIPSGCTPLYDAIGSTVVDLKATIGDNKNAIGSVTIITDGEENSSRHYSLSKVRSMISQLKELGWNFNFIGANIDVERYANSLGIDNHLEFKQDEKGMNDMFERERNARHDYFARVHACECENSDIAPEQRKENLKKASRGYFDKHWS